MDIVSRRSPSLANRILQNVFDLPMKLAFVANDMIIEVFLPANRRHFSRSPEPRFFLERFHGRESIRSFLCAPDDDVGMFGHEQIDYACAFEFLKGKEQNHLSSSKRTFPYEELFSPSHTRGERNILDTPIEIWWQPMFLFTNDGQDGAFLQASAAI